MKNVLALGLSVALCVAGACGDDDGGGDKNPASGNDSGTDGGSSPGQPDGGGTVLPDGSVVGPDGSVIVPDAGQLPDAGNNGGGPTSTVITTAGGTAKSADGILTVTFPPRAFERPTTVVIKPLTPAPAGAAGVVYDVQPAQEPFQQNQPTRPKATLKYTTADLMGGQPSDLQFAVWAYGRWDLLDGRVKSSAMEISAELERLGPLGLIGGLCEACTTTCSTDSCVFGDSRTAGDCVAYGMGCTVCRPKCDTDRDGYCTSNTAPSFDTGGDCNEGNASIHPNAPELCNGVDDNCNDAIDEGCTACTTDAECAVSGQYCNPQTRVCEICNTQCAGGAGAACTLGYGTDTAPGVCFGYGKFCARCVAPNDTDGDGQVEGATVGPITGGDCLPMNASAFKGAPEVCGNNIDDDCSGVADDNCACANDAACGAGQACVNGACVGCTSTCEAGSCAGTCNAFGNGCGRCVTGCDTDGDGACAPNDCQPNNPNVGPTAVELCGDKIDNDCNGHVDEGCTACAADTDCKEGNEFCSAAGACDVCPNGCDANNCGIDPPYGSTGIARAPGMCRSYGVGCSACVATCDPDGDGFCAMANVTFPQLKGGDCGPSDPKVYPGAPELCGNMIDDDCDGIVDEDCTNCAASAMCTTNQECSNSR
jgi:Putative metal-binding motif